MTGQIEISQQQHQLDIMRAIGKDANDRASAGVFADYTARRAPNTTKRQRADLDLFARMLATVGIETSGAVLQAYAESWRGMTWGIVDAFQKWMLLHGYAVGSVNVRLSTVKTYAGLAHQSGNLDTSEYALIKGVKGFTYRDGANIDDRRATTRIGTKKAESVALTSAQVKALKNDHEDTPQGRRDAVIMTLLLDHGLRCGELAMLMVTAFNFDKGTFTFWREKVGKEQTHKLTQDSMRAICAYFDSGDAPALGTLLRASTKGGSLTHAGMSQRAITKRVNHLGETLAAVACLSAHDARHSWATRAAPHTDPFVLQEAGGWNSLAMPRRYIEAAVIANERLHLGDDSS